MGTKYLPLEESVLTCGIMCGLTQLGFHSLKPEKDEILTVQGIERGLDKRQPGPSQPAQALTVH